jgi:CTP synthase (UTP-ammonia lyase)
MNTQPVRIALIGDYSPAVTAHRAIDASFQLAGQQLPLVTQWRHTSTLTRGQALDNVHGFWCVPASPYANTEGALWAIEWARTRRLPFLGTCGGFQHALLEIARHALGQDAAHAELDPEARDPLIAPLACALVEKSEEIQPVPSARGRFAQWYGPPRREGFHCSYGLNPRHESMLATAGVEIAARGATGEVRAIELLAHPFFIATLFQPERAALHGELHPLVRAFVTACAEH